MLKEGWHYLGAFALLIFLLLDAGNIYASYEISFFRRYPMAMVTGILPVVGVPLPMISWGGTVMIATMISMGFVMNAFIFRRIVLGLHNDG